jgi:hypothetical protein
MTLQDNDADQDQCTEATEEVSGMDVAKIALRAAREAAKERDSEPSAVGKHPQGHHHGAGRPARALRIRCRTAGLGHGAGLGPRGDRRSLGPLGPEKDFAMDSVERDTKRQVYGVRPDVKLAFERSRIHVFLTESNVISRVPNRTSSFHEFVATRQKSSLL